eukprot:TRINITY_DN23748_c0_g1_i2.p1 TRINITY_DN23748_c0_g1~~TRINITY_DN23748_c0_g1_i2.p1  ORF type:complete len:239 (-),score=15.84 TRINITY_DN23748_c0_g1_i2:113-739(-)
MPADLPRLGMCCPSTSIVIVPSSAPSPRPEEGHIDKRIPLTFPSARAGSSDSAACDDVDSDTGEESLRELVVNRRATFVTRSFERANRQNRRSNTLEWLEQDARQREADGRMSRTAEFELRMRFLTAQKQATAGQNCDDNQTPFDNFFHMLGYPSKEGHDSRRSCTGWATELLPCGGRNDKVHSRRREPRFPPLSRREPSIPPLRLQA